jgi:hypothetical protein
MAITNVGDFIQPQLENNQISVVSSTMSDLNKM